MSQIRRINTCVMFYNVENLFPPDPVARERFDPRISGLKNWNKERYNTKLRKLAAVFQLVKEQYQDLPIFIGLSEVQGKEPVKELLMQPVFDDKYNFVLYESMDERGVDVALLYDQTQVEILESQPLVYFFEIPDQDPENYDTTRDVLYCKLKYQNRIFNVYVLHLPSKRDDNINAPKRAYILSDLKKVIERHKENNEFVVVMGDFNENPNSESIQNFLNDPKGEPLLINPFLNLFQKNVFSAFHRRQGLLFDQILMSPEFLERSSEVLKFSKASVFNHAKLMSWDRKAAGRPHRTYAGRRYLGGYSDHFPVLVEFNLPLNTE